MKKNKREHRLRHPMEAWILRIADRKDEKVFHHRPGIVYIWTYDIQCQTLGLKTRVLFALSPRFRGFDARIIRPDASPPPGASSREAVLWPLQPVGNAFDLKQGRATFNTEEALRSKEAVRAIRKWVRRKEARPDWRELKVLIVSADAYKTYRRHVANHLPVQNVEEDAKLNWSVVLGQRYGKLKIKKGGMPRDLQRIVRDPIHRNIAGLFANVTQEQQLPQLLQRWRALQKKAFGRSLR